MRRLHLFEFNDSAFCPRFIRDSIVEAVGAGMRRGRIYAPVTRLFRDFCTRNQLKSIIDLGSGTGEPISILIKGLEEDGMHLPQFYLSDLYPNIDSMRHVADRHPQLVHVIEDGVDATDIPQDLEHQARTIVATFHHFPPERAQEILADCVRNRKAIFIVEPFPRGPRYALPVILHGFLPSLANPFFARTDRLLKFTFTYLVPIIGFLGLWDGFISSLRMYTEEDLMQMVEPFEGYEWQFHRLPIRWGTAVTVFTGVPGV